MKKTWRKMLELFLTVFACVWMFSLVAGAQPLYPKTQYCYLGGKSRTSTATLVISGIPANQKITKATVKSSAPSVAKLEKLSCSLVYEEEAELGKSPVSSAKYTRTYTIQMELRKPGTSKITFQVGNKKYTSVVRVLSYTNAISNFTVTGIKNGNSTNLAGKFLRDSYARVKLPKTQNNGTISIKAASGWKITSAYYMANGRNRMMTSKRGVTALTLFAGKMLAGDSGRSLNIKVKNSKLGAEIEYRCEIE